MYIESVQTESRRLRSVRTEHGRDRHGSAEEDQDSHMDRAGDACSLAGSVRSCEHGSMYRLRFAGDRQEWSEQLHPTQHGKIHQVHTQYGLTD